MWFLCATIAVGCGGKDPAGEGSTTQVTTGAAGALEVTLSASTQSEPEPRMIGVGETLRSGDKIAWSVSVTRPAYIYVLQFFPDGSAAVLFPDGAENNRVDESQRIPPSGWFQLDDAQGQENVYVVASVDPLERVDESVSAAINEVQTTGRAPDPGDSGEASQSVPDASPISTIPAATPDAAPPAGSRAVASAPDAGSRRIAHGAGGPKSGERKSPERAKTTPGPGGASLRTRGLFRVQDDKAVTLKADDDGVAIYRFWFEHAGR